MPPGFHREPVGLGRGAPAASARRCPCLPRSSARRSASTPGSVSLAAVRPLHLDLRHLLGGAEAEGQRQLALRQIARSGLHHLPGRRGRRRGHARERADGVAVRFRADEPDPKPVAALAAVVSQQPGRPVVGRDRTDRDRRRRRSRRTRRRARRRPAAARLPERAVTASKRRLPTLRNRCGACA